MSKNEQERCAVYITWKIKYYLQKGEKDALDDRMNNKPLSPRRKSPEKKNVASLQVKLV